MFPIYLFNTRLFIVIAHAIGLEIFSNPAAMEVCEEFGRLPNMGLIFIILHPLVRSCGKFNCSYVL